MRTTSNRSAMRSPGENATADGFPGLVVDLLPVFVTRGGRSPSPPLLVADAQAWPRHPFCQPADRPVRISLTKTKRRRERGINKAGASAHLRREWIHRRADRAARG